jgi:hypothetical protein
MQGAGVNLVLNNLSLGDESSSSSAKLEVAHNAETLNIKSTGGGNFLANPDLGGFLSTLNISGDAHLYIKGDLASSMHSGTPVTIDAATNSGGVNLTLTGSDEVTFTGSKGDDRFDVTADVSVTITGGTGNNVYIVDTETAIITNSDGNNRYDVTADVAKFTVGNGNNEFDLTVDQADIKAGNGDNKISAEGADAVVIEAGDGDNQIEASAKVIDVTTGAGDDQIVVSGNYAEGETIDALPEVFVLELNDSLTVSSADSINCF